MNYRPRAVLGLVWTAAAGVAAGTFQTGSGWMYVGAVALPLLFVRRAGAGIYVATLVVSLFAGHAVAQAERDRDAPMDALAADVPRCSLEGTVSEQAGALGTLLSVDRLVCDNGEIGFGELITDEMEHDPGTALVADGWLLPLTVDRFDAARRRTGAAAVFHTNEVEVVRGPSGVLGIAAAFRGSLTRSTGSLEARAAALLRGLTIGDTSGIDEGLEWQFRRTGLAHLVAVSGSNVAIVIAGAALFLRRGVPTRAPQDVVSSCVST